MTPEEAAKRIAIPKARLANWASAAKRGSDPTAPPGSRSVAELEAGVAKLRKELAAAYFGMPASMSCKGNSYDKAPMESFEGRLKNEMIQRQRVATRADAKSAISGFAAIVPIRRKGLLLWAKAVELMANGRKNRMRNGMAGSGR